MKSRSLRATRQFPSKVAESVDGCGKQVTGPEKLQDAKRDLEANRSGKPAIIDVIVG